MNAIILSPSIKSRYTVAVAHALQSEGFTVTSIVVRRMLQLGRIRSEWRSARSRLLTKIVRRGLQLDSDALAESDVSIARLISDAGLPADVRAFCDARGVRLLLCNDFGDDVVLDALDRERPDAVFFAGGGMIRKPVLDRAGAGVVNCHMGPLPEYRGMDVIEWPVLMGRGCEVTCHFMDEGLDTGPILLSRSVPLRRGDSFAKIRVRAEVVMVEAMRDVARGLREGTLQPRAQAFDEGRQYFAMHPRMLAEAREQLARTIENQNEPT